MSNELSKLISEISKLQNEQIKVSLNQQALIDVMSTIILALLKTQASQNPSPTELLESNIKSIAPQMKTAGVPNFDQFLQFYLKELKSKPSSPTPKPPWLKGVIQGGRSNIDTKQ